MNDKMQYVLYTDRSTGSLSFKDGCRFMKEHNFKNIVVIDVNRIQHLKQKLQKYNDDEINIKLGIEILTYVPGISIIAWGIRENEYFNIENFVDYREKKINYDKILEKLKEKYKIDLYKKEVLFYSNKNFLNSVDIAKVMYQKGYTVTVREAIRDYLNKCFDEMYDEIYDIKSIIELLLKRSEKIYYYIYDNNEQNKKYINFLKNIGLEQVPINIFENHHVENIKKIDLINVK